MKIFIEKINRYYLLLFLSFLSGICGLAYEVLYARMISSYFGDIFYISAAVLFTFFFGIGMGSLYSNKVSKYLAYFEVLIGLYSLFLIFIFSNYSQALVRFAYSLSLTGPLLLTVLTFIFLFVPSLLIGFSVPLFAHYLSSYSKKRDEVFSFKIIYFFYNLGAAICVLFIEFYLLRNFGLYSSLFFVALINLFTGAIIFLFIKPLNQKKPSFSWIEIKNNKRVFGVLFIVNVVTGIFYLLILQTLNYIFGPLHENFAIVLFVSLITLSFGSFILLFFSFSFKKLLLYISYFVLFFFGLAIYFIFSWVYLQDYFQLNGASFILLKVVLISLYFGIFYFLFGIVEPVFLEKYSKLVGVGGLLGISSAGMCVGFLLMTFVLFGNVSFLIIIIVLALILWLLHILEMKSFGKSVVVKLLIFVVLALFLIHNWPGSTLQIGFSCFQNISKLKTTLNRIKNVKSFEKYNNSVAVINFPNNERWLALNGYVSLSFWADKRTQLRETMVSLSGIPFLKDKTDDALIFGLGSGITVGAASNLFKNVDVAEINPVMEEVVKIFSAENYNLSNKKNVQVEIQDAYVSLLKSKKKYNLIVNTVPSPYFYSASKLWTKDVYELVSDSLAPGGVYTAWFDFRVGDQGIRTMANTFESSFEYCRYQFLSPGYFLAVCSNDPLEYNFYPNSYYPEEIREVFAQNQITDISNYLYYRFFQPSSSFYDFSNSKVNYIDFPVLEYETSSRIVWGGDLENNLYNLIFENFSYDPITQKNINSDQIKDKCESYKKGNEQMPTVNECRDIFK